MIVVLSFLLLTACSSKSLKGSQATPTPIPTPIIAAKPTYQVQRGDLVNELKFSGRIAPITTQELSFTTGERVAKVYVQRGDAVSEGQLNSAYTSVRITSPISGTIFSISIADRNMVEANKPVMVVANMDKLMVSADLSQDQMALLTVRMKVAVDPVGRSIPEVLGSYAERAI